MTNDYIQTHFYLDKRITIVTVMNEMRMSHWLYVPTIFYTHSKESILDLEGTLWSLEKVVEKPSSIQLELRKYPGDQPSVCVEYNISEQLFFLNEQEIGKEQLLKFLDDYGSAGQG